MWGRATVTCVLQMQCQASAISLDVTVFKTVHFVIVFCGLVTSLRCVMLVYCKRFLSKMSLTSKLQHIVKFGMQQLRRKIGFYVENCTFTLK